MSDVWYHQVGGQLVGPLTLADLQRMAADGSLKPTDRISGDGSSWITARELPDLSFPVAFLANPHDLNCQAPTQVEIRVSHLVVDLMRQTARWVRIMSVLMFISSGFMLLGGGVMIIAGLLTRAADPSLFIGIIYIPMALLYIVPAVYLHRYASHAKAFSRLRNEQELELAIGVQKSFWKFVAVTALIIVGLYLIFISIFIIATVIMHK